MVRVKETPANGKKLAQIDQTFKGLLHRTLKPGFSGLAAVALKPHDGTIRQIASRIEETMK